ncbi:MAG: hypothetical protein HRT82_08755 [Henriciella sp.]|nr:hypothetical protein [Henriciella sp.]
MAAIQGARSDESIASSASTVRILAPWNGVLIQAGGRLKVASKPDLRSMSSKTAAQQMKHLDATAKSIDLLDVAIAQQKLLSGELMVGRAAEVLDEKVIPAYFEARVLHKPEKLNALLGYQVVDKESIGPNCATGNLAWDTLCLMENNPHFRRNVLRELTLRALENKDLTIDDWLAAVRSPFSAGLYRIFDRTYLFRDLSAEEDLKDYALHSSLGFWALDLPRVHTDPKLDSSAQNCFLPGNVDVEVKEGVASIAKQYYQTDNSVRCHFMDDFATDIRLLDYPGPIRLLATNRVLNAMRMIDYCRNPYYLNTYCENYR